jgi:hypothetical protein
METTSGVASGGGACSGGALLAFGGFARIRAIQPDTRDLPTCVGGAAGPGVEAGTLGFGVGCSGGCTLDVGTGAMKLGRVSCSSWV